MFKSRHNSRIAQRAVQASTCLSLIAFLSISSPASAAADNKESQTLALSIKKLVQESDILDNDYKQQVFASYSNGVATVSLFRHPDASRADCKIDAVLLSRKIIALAAHDIKVIRCVFYDYDRQNEYWDVEVRAQLVSAFAQGKIGERELIDSILLTEDKQKNPLSAKFSALSYSGIVNADSVCPGAFEDKRLAIHLRLKELSSQKLEIGHFRDDYFRLEDAARRGKDKELLAQINTLNKALDDYLQGLINSGQIQKPELRRAKSALGQSPQIKNEPAKGL
ncbi:MAG: hypothetical protein K2X27_14450 [Candidatus Obscuribacterales bacterium]|nr:hypothetical protein [Candidatus Obscuribacterales bacterium]